MRKRLVVLALVTGAALGSTATYWNPYTSALDEAAKAEVEVTYSVDAYEDGSGVVYRNVRGQEPQEIATLDGYVLPWDCTDNGNSECGPEAPAEVRGYKCTTFVVAAKAGRGLDDDLAITYCTDGATDWRVATDVDVEGEVV